MSWETVGAIAGGISALVAVWGAINARRSTSAAGEARKRAAVAADDVASALKRATEIEEKRFAHEQADREHASAPTIDVGESHGDVWVLAQAGTALVGDIVNVGVTAARLKTITIDAPVESTVQIGPVVVVPGDRQRVEVPWPGVEPPSEMTMHVAYGHLAGDAMWRATFQLLRRGSDQNDQPLWRSVGVSRYMM